MKIMRAALLSMAAAVEVTTVTTECCFSDSTCTTKISDTGGVFYTNAYGVVSALCSGACRPSTYGPGYSKDTACAAGAMPSPAAGIWWTFFSDSACGAGSLVMATQYNAASCTAVPSGSGAPAGVVAAKAACTTDGGAQLWGYAAGDCGGTPNFVLDIGANFASGTGRAFGACGAQGGPASSASQRVACYGDQVAPLFVTPTQSGGGSSGGGSSGGGVPAACPAASSTTQAALAALLGQPAYGASYGPTPSYNPSASYGASPTYMPSSTFMPAPSSAPPPGGGAQQKISIIGVYSDAACTQYIPPGYGPQADLNAAVGLGCTPFASVGGSIFVALSPAGGYAVTGFPSSTSCWPGSSDSFVFWPAVAIGACTATPDSTFVNYPDSAGKAYVLLSTVLAIDGVYPGGSGCVGSSLTAPTEAVAGAAVKGGVCTNAAPPSMASVMVTHVATTEFSVVGYQSPWCTGPPAATWTNLYGTLGCAGDTVYPPSLYLHYSPRYIQYSDLTVNGVPSSSYGPSPSHAPSPAPGGGGDFWTQVVSYKTASCCYFDSTCSQQAASGPSVGVRVQFTSVSSCADAPLGCVYGASGFSLVSGCTPGSIPTPASGVWKLVYPSPDCNTSPIRAEEVASSTCKAFNQGFSQDPADFVSGVFSVKAVCTPTGGSSAQMWSYGSSDCSGEVAFVRDIGAATNDPICGAPSSGFSSSHYWKVACFGPPLPPLPLGPAGGGSGASYAPSPSVQPPPRQLQPLFGGFLAGVWPPSSQQPRPAFGGSVLDAQPFGDRQLQDAAASYAPSPSPAPGYGPTGGFTVSSQYSDSACTISSGPAVVFSALTAGSTCDSVSTTACMLVSGTSSPAAYQKVSACTPNDAIPAPTSGGLWQSAWFSSSSCSGPISMAVNVYSSACTASGSGFSKAVCTVGGGAQVWSYADSSCSGSVAYVTDFASVFAPQGLFFDNCKDMSSFVPSGAASSKLVCTGAQVAALPPSGGGPGTSYAPSPSYGPTPTFAPTLSSLSFCFSGSSRGSTRVVSVPDFAPAGARLVACGAVTVSCGLNSPACQVGHGSYLADNTKLRWYFAAAECVETLPQPPLSYPSPPFPPFVTAPPPPSLFANPHTSRSLSSLANFFDTPGTELSDLILCRYPGCNAPAEDACASLAPVASRTRSGTATPTGTPSGTPSNSRTPSGTPTVTPSPTGTKTGTGSDTRTRTGTASRTLSRTPTVSSTLSGSRTASLTSGASASETPSGSSTATLTASATATGTPSATPTPTPSKSGTGTPSVSRSTTSTASPSPTGTPTVTSTASLSRTPLPVGVSRSNTPSRSESASRTPVPTGTPTSTGSGTATRTASATRTGTRTGTPTETQSPSTTTSAESSSSTDTGTLTATPTPSLTVGASASITGTGTPSVSQTSTVSASGTATPSASPTATASDTGSRTETRTGTATRTTSPTGTPTKSGTRTATGTFAAGRSPSRTPSTSRTASRSPTKSPTPSTTVTDTPSPTATETPPLPDGASPSITPSTTPSESQTPTETPTSTGTRTPSRTPTSSKTTGASASVTPSESAYPSESPSNPASPTSTRTPSRSRRPAGASPTSSPSLSSSPSTIAQPLLSLTLNMEQPATLDDASVELFMAAFLAAVEDKVREALLDDDAAAQAVMANALRSVVAAALPSGALNYALTVSVPLSIFAAPAAARRLSGARRRLQASAQDSLAALLTDGTLTQKLLEAGVDNAAELISSGALGVAAAAVEPSPSPSPSPSATPPAGAPARRCCWAGCPPPHSTPPACSRSPPWAASRAPSPRGSPLRAPPAPCACRAWKTAPRAPWCLRAPAASPPPRTRRRSSWAARAPPRPRRESTLPQRPPS